MIQMTETLSNGAFDQLRLSEKVLIEFPEWQRESPEAYGRLLASLAGVELNGHRKETRAPTHADLYVGKTLTLTKMMTDAGTVSFGFLSNDFNPDRKSTRLNSSHIQKSRMPSSA